MNFEMISTVSLQAEKTAYERDSFAKAVSFIFCTTVYVCCNLMSQSHKLRNLRNNVENDHFLNRLFGQGQLIELIDFCTKKY